MRNIICDMCCDELDVDELFVLELRKFGTNYPTDFSIDLCQDCRDRVVKLLNGAQKESMG